MTLAEYLEYLALFNGQNWKLAFEKYYAEDVHFALPEMLLNGRSAVCKWFESVHQSVFQTLVPVTINVSESGLHITATVDGYFFLTEDTAKTPKGADGRKGDAFFCRFVVLYDVNERNQFSRLIFEITDSGDVGE